MRCIFRTHTSDGEAECQVFGFSFLCRTGTVEINEQNYDSDTPKVILVDADDQVLRTCSQKQRKSQLARNGIGSCLFELLWFIANF